MWVIFVEMGVVIAIGALIVWWTWPKKKRDEERKSGKATFDTRLMAMRWPERELWGEEGQVPPVPGQ